jgi:hypothetical protein
MESPLLFLLFEAKLLLGTRFTPLRREFRPWRDRQHKITTQVSNILAHLEEQTSRIQQQL